MSHSIMMFDFIRNLGRSEEQRQQEALSAFLDGELAPDEIARVEQDLASNSNLREELAEMQLWKSQMRDLPARRVPRNFTLDPGIYGRPQRRPFAGAYPVLRTATAVT
ncbi:MAG: zf-HC2 domain-containing protein, partial [Chloroflexota bacterium]